MRSMRTVRSVRRLRAKGKIANFARCAESPQPDAVQLALFLGGTNAGDFLPFPDGSSSVASLLRCGENLFAWPGEAAQELSEPLCRLLGLVGAALLLRRLSHDGVRVVVHAAAPFRQEQ